MGLKERISQVLLIFVVVQILLSFTSDAAAPKKDSNPFEIQLFSELVEANSDKNIFYSPLSIKMCLAMIRQGATDETGRQIDAALTSAGQGHERMADQYHDVLQKYENATKIGSTFSYTSLGSFYNFIIQKLFASMAAVNAKAFTSTSPEKMVDEFHNILQKYRNNKILKIASKIYIMNGLEAQTTFNDVLTQKFFASIESINFNNNMASASAINSWVERQSDIKDLISPAQLDGDTHMVVVNALRFKGEWVSKFDPRTTFGSTFKLEDGTEFNVKMMSQTGNFNTSNTGGEEPAVLEMPYKDSNFSMVIVLPRIDESLSDVEKRFNSIDWTEEENMFYFTEVDVRIPKFKLEFETELSRPLIGMGLQRIFSSDAELDKMLTEGGEAVSGLRVDKIFHKTFIEVDEGGTTAGAATGSAATALTLNPPFIADRPFYFFIKDEMNNKIFEGRVNKRFSF